MLGRIRPKKKIVLEFDNKSLTYSTRFGCLVLETMDTQGRVEKWNFGESETVEFLNFLKEKIHGGEK